MIGVKAGKEKKAYDWNQLIAERIINDKLDGKNIVVILAQDNKSFFAFENPDANNNFTIHNDTLIQGNLKYTINGKAIGNNTTLKPLPAYQEFWHSWRTFNGETKK